MVELSGQAVVVVRGQTGSKAGKGSGRLCYRVSITMIRSDGRMNDHNRIKGKGKAKFSFLQ